MQSLVVDVTDNSWNMTNQRRAVESAVANDGLRHVLFPELHSKSAQPIVLPHLRSGTLGHFGTCAQSPPFQTLPGPKKDIKDYHAESLNIDNFSNIILLWNVRAETQTCQNCRGREKNGKELNDFWTLEGLQTFIIIKVWTIIFYETINRNKLDYP